MQHLKDLLSFSSQSFFLRNPCTLVYDMRSVQWVDLRHKTKRFLFWPQLAEEEIQEQPGKQAEGIHITEAYASSRGCHGVTAYPTVVELLQIS